MIQRFETGARMSEAVVHQGTVYLAGQVPEDGSLDIGGQTEQVLAAIDALLAAATRRASCGPRYSWPISPILPA